VSMKFDVKDVDYDWKMVWRVQWAWSIFHM